MSGGNSEGNRGRARSSDTSRPLPGAAEAAPAQKRRRVTERNRRNAQHSTGPRTRTGKMTARWNALRHGLWIRECLIPMGQGKESRQHLMKLLSIFRRDFDVCGIAEELLVERLAVIYWKLSRHDRAEVGEIRLGLDFARDRMMTEWAEDFDNPDTDIRMPFIRHWRQLQSDFRQLDAIETMVSEGRLRADALAAILKAMRTVGAKLMLTNVVPYADGRELSPALRAQILDSIRQSRRYLQRASDTYGENGMTELAMRVDAEDARCHAPDTPRAGYLMRREASLDAQFNRLLRQLERLQSARGGGPVRWFALGAEDPSRDLPFEPEPEPDLPTPSMGEAPLDVDRGMAAQAQSFVSAHGEARLEPEPERPPQEQPAADPPADGDQAPAPLSWEERVDRKFMEALERTDREGPKNPSSTDIKSKPPSP